MRQRWLIVALLAPLALMLLLVTSNVRFAANSLTVYGVLFERHGVPERTGITTAGLRDVGRQIQDYFNSDVEPLRVTAAVHGAERELFNEDEVSHMADVKHLFLLTYRVQAASALFLLAVGAIAWWQLRRDALREYARWLRRGALLTFGAIGGLAVASLVAFGPLFTLFHYIGFPQGNWLFDPRTDYLVRVFPFGFWQDVTLLIGALTLLQAAVLLGAGVLLTRKAATHKEPVRAAARARARRAQRRSG